MNNVIPLFDSYSDCNNPAEYEKLSENQKAKLQHWIDRYIKPHQVKKYNPYHSSYGLKHLFEQQGGFYITNGQLKGAMLAAGLEPETYSKRNWIFKIGKRAGTIKKSM
ncbi:hypothetical protein ACQKMN_16915 [Ureibacillus composti]